jgi:hypothetical protein
MTTEAERRLADGSAWRDFCRALERAGEVVLRAQTPTEAFDRAEGYRYLTRLLRAGLESQLEFADPRFPGFFSLSHETIKIGNDNPDNIYRNANVSGRYRYRIHGTRGGAPYISFGTKGGGYESDGTMLPTGQLDGDQLEIGVDGTFEIVVSSEPENGNWLPMQATTTQLIVRETFSDRRSQQPARLAIERIGGPLESGPPRSEPQASEGGPLHRSGPPEDDALDPALLEQRLSRAVAFVSGTANLFVDWMARYAAHPNALPSDDQAICQRAGGDANIHYCQSRWQLGRDEALVIEIDHLPKRGSWNFQLSNFWMESLDYRHHRIHLNPHTAQLERDGSLRIVVAQRDPGKHFPNWLATAGHTQGGMLFRWIGADEHPPIATRVVKLTEL